MTRDDSRMYSRPSKTQGAFWRLWVLGLLVWTLMGEAAFGQIISTVAGGYLGDGNSAILASLSEPGDVFQDGTDLYIADTRNNRVRKVDGAGNITTVAGGGTVGWPTLGDGGQATAATLSSPTSLFVDGAGNLYIADGYGRIRKVNLSSGVITTVAGGGSYGSLGDGGPATAAYLAPTGVCVDASGNIYISDVLNNRIRKVDAVSGTISTVAGSGVGWGSGGFSGDGGPATSASLNQPTGVSVDGAGNLYIADTQNSRVRKVDAATGIISTAAGGGTAGWPTFGDGGQATDASVYYPQDVFVDGGGYLYIAESGYGRVRKVTSGNITTVAGNGNSGFSGDGGPATSANLLFPRGVYVDGVGNITIADTGNDRVRKVDAASSNITTVAGGYIGDGSPATQANLKILYGRQDIFVDGAGNLYIPDSGHNRVRKVSPSGVITTVAGGGTVGWPTFGDGGAATAASLNTPASVFVDGSGNLHIADANNQRVRKVDPSGVISTVAGGSGWGSSGDGGPATSAQLSYVTGICLDASGKLYIADNQNHRIRKVDATTQTITTVAGNGAPGYSGDNGPATAASLNQPTGVSVDGAGNLYIADAQNSRIRKVDTSGNITTVAGGGTAGWPSFGDGGPATGASLSWPQGVFADGGGNLYIAEGSYSRVRKVNASGIISTVTGNNNWGFSGDGGLATSAQLASPTGVFRDPLGNLYIADSGNNRVRKVSPPSTVIRLTASPTQITTGADASTLQAKLLDQSGTLKTGDNSTVITFSMTAGVGSLSATTVTVTGGVATTTLTSSTIGTVTVQASAYDAEGASVSVVVAAPARQIALTANPGAIVADGVSASTVQAQIQDLSGALQSSDNSTVVTFEATPNVVTGGAGSLSATTVTVTGGIATTTLTGSLPGIVDVKASALGAQSRTVSVTLKVSAPPPGEPPPPGEVGPGQITTVAGGYLGDGNPATLASLSMPQGVAVDAAGNIYIADVSNNRVRMVNPSGVITTVAGGGTAGWPTLGDGGAATSATLSSPSGVFVDGSGNLYIADSGYGRVRKVDASGNITTVAGGNYGSLGDGGLATDATLNYPRGVVADGAGNLYIADSQNHRIRKVDATTKIITTVAGNGTQGASGDGGPATNASLYYPQGVSLDGSGNLYIADTQNNRIRRVNLSSGVISTVAGGGAAGWPSFGDGGAATGATLNYPSGVFADGSGLYIAEGSYGRIRKVDASGIITTVAGGNNGSGFSGDGGPATAAQLNFPAGVFKDASGNLYIADTNNHRVRKVNTSGIISTVAGGYIGDGSLATSASLKLQYQTPGLFVDGAGNLYIPDSGNNRVRRVNTSGVITTVAGGGTAGWPSFGDGGQATSASLNWPQGVFMDGSGNLYISESGYSRIRKVNPSGVISTVAGGGPYGSLGDGGPATGATLNYPTGIFVDALGNLYIADSNNHRVRKVNTSGVISTVAGNGTPGSSGDGGQATSASLNWPQGVCVDGAGNLYVATNNDGRVRKVDAVTGVITTVAGGGTAGWPTLGDGGPATDATLSYPTGVYVDQAGNLYIADRFNHRVRKVASGIITTVAGGTYGFSGDGGPATAAAMNAPSGLFMDGSGNLYIADSGNNRVRKANLSAPTAATPTGTNVSTQLTDPVTGTSPATLTFSNVTQAGETTLTQSDSGPPPPSGFELGDTPIYFDISTTAVFSGPVDLCVTYSDADVTDEANLKLFHYEGGAWVDVTTSLDTINNVLCGQVTSLSPFAVFVARKKELKVSALTGAQRVEIGKAANVTGDVLSGGEVQVQGGDDKRPGLITGSLRTVGDARIGRNNRITGNVTLGGKLLLPEKKQASTVVIDGTVAEHAQVDSVRLPPVVLSVDPNGGRVKVKQKESADLPPNSASNPAYGNLDADHHATVTLRSGTYYFDKFVMKHDAKLVIQIDRGAPITVNVKQGLQMGHHSSVTIQGGDASHVLFNIGGAGILPEADEDDEPPPEETPRPASRIQHHAQFSGTLYSPAGELRLEHDAVVEGALIGREVRTDQEVRFTGKVASHLDLSGRSVLAKPALADEALTFGADQNYPNPFNPATTIRYTLPEASDVRLTVYNLLGQQVRVLVNVKQMPGVYSVSWDSRDTYGRSVASGLYFYRLQAGPHVAVRKMLLMK